VRSGNINNNAGNWLRVGGDVTAGNNIANPHRIDSGGTVRANVGTDNVPDREPLGMPEIEYVVSDWTGQDPPFQPRSKDDFTDLVKSEWNVLPSQSWKTGPIENCQLQSWIAPYPKPPIDLPSTPTVYDLGDCDPLRFNNGVTLNLHADTAFFVSSWQSVGDLDIQSPSGEAHKIWFIVPFSSGAGFDPGPITSSTPINVVAPAESFWYTPETLTLRTNNFMRGQIYGGSLDFSSSNIFEYTDVGVPGGTLVSVNPSTNGSHVEIIYKREARIE
jgi:hypothetical protein